MSAFVTANLALAAWNIILSVGNLLGAPWLGWRTRTVLIAWLATSAVIWIGVFVAVPQ